MRQFYIQGKRPNTEADVGGRNHWQTVGRATELEDGTILVHIDAIPLNWVNAIPLNWDGVLKLKIDDGSFSKGKKK